MVRIIQRPFWRLLTLLLALFGFSFSVSAQTVVKGKVTDASSGDPIPFVNIFLKGTTAGTTTDFDGNYSVKTTSPVDSIEATYIGYKKRTKKLEHNKTQVINFQLEE